MNDVLETLQKITQRKLNTLQLSVAFIFYERGSVIAQLKLQLSRIRTECSRHESFNALVDEESVNCRIGTLQLIFAESYHRNDKFWRALVAISL